MTDQRRRRTSKKGGVPIWELYSYKGKGSNIFAKQSRSKKSFYGAPVYSKSSKKGKKGFITKGPFTIPTLAPTPTPPAEPTSSPFRISQSPQGGGGGSGSGSGSGSNDMPVPNIIARRPQNPGFTLQGIPPIPVITPAPIPAITSAPVPAITKAPTLSPVQTQQRGEVPTPNNQKQDHPYHNDSPIQPPQQPVTPFSPGAAPSPVFDEITRRPTTFNSPSAPSPFSPTTPTENSIKEETQNLEFTVYYELEMNKVPSSPEFEMAGDLSMTHLAEFIQDRDADFIRLVSEMKETTTNPVTITWHITLSFTEDSRIGLNIDRFAVQAFSFPAVGPLIHTLSQLPLDNPFSHVKFIGFMKDFDTRSSSKSEESSSSTAPVVATITIVIFVLVVTLVYVLRRRRSRIAAERENAQPPLWLSITKTTSSDQLKRSNDRSHPHSVTTSSHESLPFSNDMLVHSFQMEKSESDSQQHSTRSKASSHSKHSGSSSRSKASSHSKHSGCNSQSLPYPSEFQEESFDVRKSMGSSDQSSNRSSQKTSKDGSQSVYTSSHITSDPGESESYGSASDGDTFNISMEEEDHRSSSQSSSARSKSSGSSERRLNEMLYFDDASSSDEDHPFGRRHNSLLS